MSKNVHVVGCRDIKKLTRSWLSGRYTKLTGSCLSGYTKLTGSWLSGYTKLMRSWLSGRYTNRRVVGCRDIQNWCGVGCQEGIQNWRVVGCRDIQNWLGVGCREGIQNWRIAGWLSGWYQFSDNDEGFRLSTSHRQRVNVLYYPDNQLGVNFRTFTYSFKTM